MLFLKQWLETQWQQQLQECDSVGNDINQNNFSVEDKKNLNVEVDKKNFEDVTIVNFDLDKEENTTSEGVSWKNMNAEHLWVLAKLFNMKSNWAMQKTLMGATA